MKRRRITQALCDQARELCRTRSRTAAAAILGLQPSQLVAIEARGWKEAARRRRPIPADFAAVSATMTTAALAIHYKAGRGTIARWFNELPGRRRSWKGDALRRVPLGPNDSRGPKSEAQIAAVRARQWQTRREKYGPTGHAGAKARSNRRKTTNGDAK